MDASAIAGLHRGEHDLQVGYDLLRRGVASSHQPPSPSYATERPADVHEDEHDQTDEDPDHTYVYIASAPPSTATSRAPSPALPALPPDRSLPKPRRAPSVNWTANVTAQPSGLPPPPPAQAPDARPPPAPRLAYHPQLKRDGSVSGPVSESPLVHRLREIVDTSRQRLRMYARAASEPRTYIHFLRSLHPSLVALFLVSVSATLSNKTLLRGFFQGLTYSLTTWQLACATLGTMLAERIGVYRPQRVPTKHVRLVQAVAFVFSCEILCSNLALRLVPVPVSALPGVVGSDTALTVVTLARQFHVSLRAASPFLTLVLSVLFFGERTTLNTASSLLVVLLGVALTSHHEAWLSTGSVLLSASAVLLTAKSLLVSHLLESRLHLGPLDILARLSPLSMTHCAVFAILNAEPRKLWTFVRGAECTRAHVAQVALNGVLSFGSVVLGLVAEKRTRPPALAIAAHAAQASTILFSLVLFGLRLSGLNFVGVALTLAGGVLYARSDAQDKKDRTLSHGSLLETPDLRGGGGAYLGGGGTAGSSGGGGIGEETELPTSYATPGWSPPPPREKQAPD